MDEIPHPRDRRNLIGHRSACGQLLAAESSGRLHHAWLIGGPVGIGKATLAYRFARYLLASRAERTGGDDGLAVDPLGRTARRIAAGSHPNLAVLERVAPDGEKAPPRTIAVEAVRKTLALFASTAADGGRRICIVDSVDDLTLQAANALLKTVEEPPPGALVLLVSHAPERVLPTIRSRCRHLRLGPLSETEVVEVLGTLDLGQADATAARAAIASEGSVARALALLDPKRLALLDDIASLLASLPDPPVKRVLSLADKLADRRASDELPLALDAVQRWLGERVRIAAGQGAANARLAPLAELWDKLAEAAATVEAYSLDRRAFVVTTFGDLAEAVRRAA